MYSFYKSENVNELLFLLMKKARKDGASISVCFPNAIYYEELSRKIWCSSQVLAHGLPEDGFINEQPIMFDTILHEKDVAIIFIDAISNLCANGVELDQQLKEFGYKKVILIGGNADISDQNKCGLAKEFAIQHHTTVKFWQLMKPLMKTAMQMKNAHEWSSVSLDQFFS